MPHLCHLLTVHARQICIANAQDLISTAQAFILVGKKEEKIWKLAFFL